MTARDLRLLVLPSPNATTNSTGDTDSNPHSKGDDDESDEDLSDEPLLLWHLTPPLAEPEAVLTTALTFLLACLALQRLAGWPHLAFFGAAIDAVISAWAPERGRLAGG